MTAGCQPDDRKVTVVNAISRGIDVASMPIRERFCYLGLPDRWAWSPFMTCLAGAIRWQ